MAVDKKLTDESAYGGILSLTDLVHIVDVSDTTQDPAGSSYKLQLGTIKALFDQNLSEVLAVDNKTGEQIIYSDNGFSEVSVFNSYLKTVFNNGSVQGGILADASGATIYHDTFVQVGAPSIELFDGVGVAYFNNGNFGVNISLPTARLHSKSSVGGKGLQIDGSGLNNAFYVDDNGAVSSYYGYWIGATEFLSGTSTNLTSVIIGDTTAHNMSADGGGIVIVGSGSGQNYLPAYGNTWGLVSVGYGNFSNVTGGTGNIALGTNVNQTASGTYNHSIGIGTDVLLTGSNQMVVGGAFSAISDTYFGQGVANPNGNLWFGNAVIGNPASALIANTVNLGLTKRICFDGIRALSYDLVDDAVRVSGGAVGGRIIFTNQSTTEVGRWDSGAFGINTTTPAGKFDCNGRAYFRERIYMETLYSVTFGYEALVVGNGVRALSRGELGIAYNTFEVNTPSTLTTAGCKLVAFYNNSVEKFNVDKDGTIYATLQTGNAGLIAGQMYKDTAANILANADLVVGIKV